MINRTDTTDELQKPHLFKKGQSGNPAGRPPGSRHKATLAAMALLDGESEKLTRMAIEAALGGDMTALRLCLDRIVPPIKERPVNIRLPIVENATDLPKITAALLSAVSRGDIDPGQAVALAKVVDIHRSTMELADIEERLNKLEVSINEKRHFEKN